MAPESGTYVYCLVADRRRPALTRRPPGLPGTGRARLIDVSDRAPNGLKSWLVAADAPLDRFGEAAINRGLADVDWVARAAVAHEAMIESFGRARAVLPMKLFTIFTTDARARDHIREEQRRIDALIRRVSQRQEWGVRVMLDAGAAVIPDTPHRPGRGGSKAPAAHSGKNYLLQKKAQRDRIVQLSHRARATVSGLYKRLAALASAATRKSPGNQAGARGRLLLDAAFLVPLARSGRFRRAVERESRALRRDGYQVTLTGPWPPYSFVEG